MTVPGEPVTIIRMAYLDDLESRSIYIIREAFSRLKPMAMLWSMGKDSTALLWMVRRAFYGRVPFPLYLLDTGMELPEVYAFQHRITADWNLDTRREPCPPEDTMDPTLPPASRAAARKSAGLKTLIEREKLRGLIVGIRRDEQSTRAKERVFSPRTASGAWNSRQQPAEFWDQYHTRCDTGAHIRVHPLLHWTEVDIWRYTQREAIPFVDVYLARDGRRYRSIGERNITVTIPSTAASLDDIIAELETTRAPERAGRTMDHETEDAFERLRVNGYM